MPFAHLSTTANVLFTHPCHVRPGNWAVMRTLATDGRDKGGEARLVLVWPATLQCTEMQGSVPIGDDFITVSERAGRKKKRCK